MAPNSGWAAKIAVSSGSLILSLLLLEGAFRIFVPTVYKKPRQVVYQDRRVDWCCGPERMGEDGIYGYIPNSFFKHCYDGPGAGQFESDQCVSYQLNNLGFRDQPRALKKPADTYRILILGDSFTVGEGVLFDDIYSQQWSQRLAHKTIQGKKIEVLNLGVPGSYTGSELQRYLKQGVPFGADLLVVQWNTNDFPSSSLYKDHEKLIGYQYRNLFKTLERFSYSRLLQWGVQRWVTAKISKEIISLNQDEVNRGESNLRDIQAFRDVARAQKADFVLLLFPELIRFKDYPYANIVQHVENFCRQEGIATVNLLPELRTYRDRELWAHETDHHPNRTAHRIAAEQLMAYLEPRTDR